VTHSDATTPSAGPSSRLAVWASTTAAGDGSTTGQRTHRYLRIALVALVLILLASVVVEVVRSGEVQPSISHYFYTPARNIFVGCLVGVSVALLALSGRDLETALLDVAAIFAPLIALIPTGFDDAPAPSSPDAIQRQCPADADCLPAAYLPEVHNGVIVYAIAVILVVVASLVVRAKQRQRLRGTVTTSVLALGVAAALLVLAFVPGVSDGFPFNDALPISIHFAVTIAFFLAFAAVPLVHALPGHPASDSPVHPWQRVVYVAAPTLIVIDLGLLLALMTQWPLIVFWGELAALLLFALFWLTQTIQRWREANPPSLV
jgi:hypothetical protein